METIPDDFNPAFCSAQQKQSLSTITSMTTRKTDSLRLIGLNMMIMLQSKVGGRGEFRKRDLMINVLGVSGVSIVSKIRVEV